MDTRRRILGWMICAALAVAPMTALSNGQLSKGKILVYNKKVSGSDVPMVVVKAVVNAPPAKVWRVVEDCDSYEDTMNRVESARLIKKKGKIHICEVEIDLPFPLSNLTAVTRGVHTVSSKKWSRKWTLIRGDYNFNNGSWVLKPYGKNGKRTLVIYKAHTEPKTAVPDWVRTKAQKSALPKMMERLRREVRKL